MKLWHVSEDGGIERFEPRVPPTPHPAITRPVVWAVDDLRLPNYLLPRDCPRVTCYPLPESSDEDRERLIGPGAARHVVAIESRWLERARRTVLWLYALPPQPFACIDETAGYFVSRVAVKPLRRHRVDDPLDRLAARGVELRAVPSLWPLARAVTASTLAFSCIRMRHAEPEGRAR